MLFTYLSMLFILLLGSRKINNMLNFRDATSVIMLLGWCNLAPLMADLIVNTLMLVW